MRLNRMLVGSLIVIIPLSAFLIICFWPTTVIVDEAMPLSSVEGVGIPENLTYESVDIAVLERYLSEDEVTEVNEALAHLFLVFLRELVATDQDPKLYYRYNTSVVEETLGINELEVFVGLYNKVVRVPLYEHCKVMVQPDSLMDDEDSYLFDIKVQYDEMSEVLFHVKLDRKDLSLSIE